MYEAIRRVVNAGMKVALVTNCKYGGVYSEYGGIGGNKSLKDIGVIMADDLNGYQAMVVATLLFENEKLKDINFEEFFSNKIK